MIPPKGVKLVSAEYVEDYKFKFTFSNKRESVVDFYPIITHGTSLRKFLNKEKFKKINIDKENGDIYWGKNWEMCFHISSYYFEIAVTPVRKLDYSKYTFQEMARLGMEKLAKQKPVTLEEARAQVKWLKERSVEANKKRR